MCCGESHQACCVLPASQCGAGCNICNIAGAGKCDECLPGYKLTKNGICAPVRLLQACRARSLRMRLPVSLGLVRAPWVAVHCSPLRLLLKAGQVRLLCFWLRSDVTSHLRSGAAQPSLGTAACTCMRPCRCAAATARLIIPCVCSLGRSVPLAATGAARQGPASVMNVFMATS